MAKSQTGCETSSLRPVSVKRLGYNKSAKEPFHVKHLLIVGKTSHDSRVHNPIHKHGEGIDGEVGVGDVSLHHAAELLVGQLHRFYGVLKWTDLHL